VQLSVKFDGSTPTFICASTTGSVLPLIGIAEPGFCRSDEGMCRRKLSIRDARFRLHFLGIPRLWLQIGSWEFLSTVSSCLDTAWRTRILISAIVSSTWKGMTKNYAADSADL